MSDTQEIAPAGGLDDLAAFLTDTPETEPENEDEGAEESIQEDTEDAADDQPEESDEEGDEPKSEEEEPDETPKPDRKIAVTIKGDDGEDTTTEVSEEELVKGYTRQADYSRKTQELAQRETQAVEFLKGKHEEIRNSYLQRAETIEAAFTQMAGIKSDEEMAQLAHSDPAAWVQESQRKQAIMGFVSNLRQQTQAEREQAQQQAQQAQQQAQKSMYERAWSELSKDKIDKPTLKKIYEGVQAGYGFTERELSEVYDPRLVRMFRDAQQYRELKAKAPEVKKQAAQAPRPPSRQAQNLNTRKSQELDRKFKGGRARLDDLASYLNMR